jgi:outer membrane protein
VSVIPRYVVATAVVIFAHLAAVSARAQMQAPLNPPTPGSPAPATLRLTIDDARQRVLGNNKLLKLAAHNVQSKAHATGAARSDFFPKITGNTVFLHFSDALGTVVTTQGRPRLGMPPRDIAANVVNQNTEVTNIVLVQPITDLLKVQDGVRIAKADEQIAQAQLEKGTRELLSDVDQLYWGLLAALKIRAGVLEGYRGAEKLAQLGTVEVRTALLEAKQGLQQVDVQVADLKEELNILLDFPPCACLELFEPPLPGRPVACAEDAINLAMAASPDLREAAQNIAKARAATHAARLDFIPSIAATGGYTNQTAASYIQQNFGYIGVVGTYTFVDWGKRKNVIGEREHLISMATLKYQQVQDDIRQKALKAYRGLAESYEVLTLSQELVAVRKEAETKALPNAMTNPAPLIEASKARGTAEVDSLKADLAYRQAHVELSKLIGR